MTPATRVICPLWFLAHKCHCKYSLSSLKNEPWWNSLSIRSRSVGLLPLTHMRITSFASSRVRAAWQFTTMKYGFAVTNGSLSAISAMVFSS